MSAYTDFVRQHLKSAKGATQKDKFRAVAAMWRARKGRGAGLATPGAMVGRGMRRVSKKGGRVNSLPAQDKGDEDCVYPMQKRRGLGRSMMGGALNGMISSKQKAALARLIRSGGAVGGKKGASKGMLADLLKGLDISIN